MFNTFATHKKLMTLIIVILAVILGILGYRAFGRIIYNVQAGKVSTDNTYCKEMAPIKVTLSNDTFNPKGRPEVTLDFKDKSVLADGKFGYWYELNLKNKTIITQRMDDTPTYFYGIYRDKSLADPVYQVDEDRNIEAWTAVEENGDTELAASYRYGLRTVLEPGTYYAAVFTTNPDDESVIKYESWYSQLKDEYLLSENDYTGFAVADNKQNTYFKIIAEQAGTVSIDFGLQTIPCTVWLCDADKDVIGEAELSPVPKKYNKQQKAMLKIDKPGTFYVKVSDYDLGRDEDGDSYKLYLDRIRYSY